MLVLDKNSAALIQYPVSSTYHQPQPQEQSGSKPATARKRCCRCTGLSLPFLGEILRRRRTCRPNNGFPPSALCQELECRRDNLPLPPSSERPWAEAMRAPLLGPGRAGRVRSDWTVVVAGDTPRAELVDN